MIRPGRSPQREHRHDGPHETGYPGPHPHTDDVSAPDTRIPGRAVRILRWARRPRVLAATVLIVLIVPLIVPVTTLVVQERHRYRIGDNVPSAPVALVLGAGVNPDGTASVFLSHRLSVAAQLYRDGKVRALVMSGDNSRQDYDEVTVMADLAVGLGVPRSAIVTDHAGFDTYSSCYRARSVWGVSRMVVVTQPYHLARAVGVCRALGIDAVGVQTLQVNNSVTWWGWLREIPAMNKAAVDVLRGRTPQFPGPREHDLDAVTGSG
jgi:vancomycin permeability regulator SanA